MRLLQLSLAPVLSIICVIAGPVSIDHNYASAQTGTAIPTQKSPSEVVREFYAALRDGRFREAFAMSVFRAAVDPLNAEEFEDLKTDFQRIAAGVPPNIVLTGEQISGDEATVFMKLGDDAAPKIEPVFLLRENGAWIVGDREKRDYVRKAGKKFFFEARIETHHGEVEAMLKRVLAAQFIYSSQHGGAYGDLNALVRAGLIPQDLLGTETTGYKFRIVVAKDSKSYSAFAEPARYGKTGRLSFYIDQTGIQSKDTGGKPLKPAGVK